MFDREHDEEIPPEEKPERIKELVGALPPEAEKEATDLIKQTDDADEVIEGLGQIIASQSPDSADEAVSKAESLAHLARMLDTDGSIISWVPARIEVLTGDETTQLKDVISEVPPAVESRADEVVQQADSTETLTDDLADLIETYYEQQADEIVTDAHSFSDLVSTLEHNQGAFEDESITDSFIDMLREKSDRGVEEAQATIEDAEPHEAAMWGLFAGAAVVHPTLGAPAIAAETSTAALVGASAAGGGAIGAYASSHEESVLAEIDPAEVLSSSKQMADQTKNIEEIDGRTLGAILGASSHLADVLTPEAYSQWVAHADAHAVLEGAALGAKYAQNRELGMSSREGLAVGAGLGLMYSYLETEDSEEQLQQVLDDDLREEYHQELEG
jgi:hypothetical protein